MAMSRDQRKKQEAPEAVISKSELFQLKTFGYEIIRKLNQGVSARVFLATHRGPERKITMACKIIDKVKGQYKFINKFLPREIAILKQLANRHCIKMYGVVDLPNKCFMFMRLAENGDLLDYLSRNGPPEEESHARMWMRQLLLAIKHLHRKRIAHRDIKCENVLITGNLNAKLADFGFSRYWVDDNGSEVLSDTYCGSISYAAPEILSGIPYLPKHCDVWSLGVVFFVMLNMAKPFTKDNAGALLKQQFQKEYKFRPRVEESLSRGAKDLVATMLEPDVNKRPSAEALLKSTWMTQDHLLLRLVPDSEDEIYNDD